MQDLLTLTSLDQLKALADPLRQRLLEGFAEEPITTKQLAQRLGEKPTRLYHHVKALEEAGLIDLVETKQKRGTVERYYLAAARQFVVDHRLLSTVPEAGPVTEEVRSLLVNTLRASLVEARLHLKPPEKGASESGMIAVAGRARVRLSPARAVELTNTIRSWLQEVQVADDPEADTQFTLTVAFYPLDKGNDTGS